MQLPSDAELFPYLSENGENGMLRLEFHMELAANMEKYIDMSSFSSYTRGDKEDFKSWEHSEKLRKGEDNLWIHMDRWLGQQLEDGAAIDSFPESEIKLFTETETNLQRKPVVDEDGEVDYEETSKTYVYKHNFNYLDKVCHSNSELTQLMTPIYKAVHPLTIGGVLAFLFHKFYFPLAGAVVFGLCYLLDEILPDTDLWLLLRVAPTLLGFAGILVAAIGLIIALLCLFIDTIPSIIEILFPGKILRQAKENFPRAYRRLRYYSLWNASVKGDPAKLREMQQIVDEYIQKFG